MSFKRQSKPRTLSYVLGARESLVLSLEYREPTQTSRRSSVGSNRVRTEDFGLFSEMGLREKAIKIS